MASIGTLFFEYDNAVALDFTTIDAAHINIDDKQIFLIFQLLLERMSQRYFFWIKRKFPLVDHKLRGQGYLNQVGTYNQQMQRFDTKFVPSVTTTKLSITFHPAMKVMTPGVYQAEVPHDMHQKLQDIADQDRY